MAEPAIETSGSPSDSGARRVTERKIPFHQSLMGKMLLFAGVPIVIVLFVVTGYTAQNMYWALLHLHEETILAHSQAAAEEINLGNLEAVTVTRAMALAQESGLFGKRRESSEYARRVVEDFPQFTAAYFGYEPNADQDDRAYLEKVGDDKGSLDSAGRFLPYWFRDKQDDSKLLLNPLVNMDTSLYYDGVKQKFVTGSEEKYMVTEPYVYEGKMIVEQTYPIEIGGRFVGIAGVDRSLEALESYLRDQTKELGVDIILISRLGKVISATMDASMKTKPIAQTEYRDILAQASGDRAASYDLQVDPLDGKEYYFASAPVETGDWTLVARVPKSLVLDQINETIRNVAIFSFFATMVIMGLLVYTARAITGRIQTAVAAAERVATGDLVCAIECRANDETGQLLSAIAVMTDDLGKVVREVINASIRLTSTATELAATSREQERTVATFGGSTTQITAAVKEISATSQELSSTMGEVTRVAGETATLANLGRKGLGDMESTMRQLTDATDSVSLKLAAIRERAHEVNMVVTTITKVADQANLLSINAAIEAEKAGEHGTGFTVVAREIRRLADLTAVATLDIERMIQEMRAAVSDGVREVDRFTQRVRAGVDDTIAARGKLEKIIEQVEALSPRFESVNEGMRSQSQGAEQIRDAMVQLSEGARQSATAVHEVNRAGADLHQAVESLRQAVSRFKLSS